MFLITAKYCTFAVWLDESERLVSEMRRKGLSSMSLGLLWDYFWVWWCVLTCCMLGICANDGCYRRYEKMFRSLELVEWWMDTSARLVTTKAWMRGLLTGGGLQGAHKAAAGLA